MFSFRTARHQLPQTQNAFIPSLSLRAFRQARPNLVQRSQIACCDANKNDQHSLDVLLKSLRARHYSSPATNRESNSQSQTTESTPATVYLVGTGPGDPGLLTLRALYLISRADVVLYDRLVSDSILSFVNSGATMIYVGKQSGFHTRSQQDIHLLLSFFASSQRIVIRLKGGDPFIFGRGGEETDFLEQCGVRVIAVPGITAASGVSAVLNIPLTMRGLATSVQYLTGHVASGANFELGPVSNLTTYVVYMGLAQLPTIQSQLIEGGIDPSTPAVAVERGTTLDQRSVAAPLCSLSHIVQNASFQSPTLIVIGRVVKLSPIWEKRGTVIVGNEHQLDQGMCFTDIEDPNLKRAFEAINSYTLPADRGGY